MTELKVDNCAMAMAATFSRESGSRPTEYAPAGPEASKLPTDEVFAPVGPAGRVRSFEHYKKLYDRSINQRDRFWGDMARQELRWARPFTEVFEGDFASGDIRWFEGGKINAADNCVDRWADLKPNDTAIIWETNDPAFTRKISWAELLQEVCRLANLLRKCRVRKHDTVGIYLPMIPELIYSMLACARIGAVHSVVFAGFSSHALRDRFNDFNCRLVMTADFGLRGNKTIRLKEICDSALAECPQVDTCLVFKYLGDETAWVPGRDIDARSAMDNMRPYVPCETMDSEDLLFLLYTSGSTGRPKGVAHTTAGYLLYTAITHKYVFDVQEGDIFACVADCGWITGHSYIVYGPLCNGCTTVLFESLPTYPDNSRYWDMVERHKITQFYTAPTALRTLMRFGDGPVKKHDLSSLRALGTVGEPINPEAWRWYFEVVGGGKLPVLDTFWQTETGGHMITPLPGITPLKPGAGTLPFFGIKPAVLDCVTGVELKGGGVDGVLCFSAPWPGQLRTVYGDHKRMQSVYYQPYPGYFFTGDGCHRDKDGYYWITGRVDDTLNISGHRVGSAEIEHALVENFKVAEATAVGYPHELKGFGLFCFVTLKEGVDESEALRNELKMQVRTSIGPIATPDFILFTQSLPKTRSGKIMRRILRKIASLDSDGLGDVSTLAEPHVVEELMAKARILLAPKK